GGDLDGAERFLVDGVQANRQLFGETWPTASLMLDLGKVQAEGGRTAEALASFRAAFAIIAAADQPPAQLPFDRIAPFLTAALAEAGKHPDQ
ncbi:tetratricopeptide repeat protein, partial [Streptococcus suis]